MLKQKYFLTNFFILSAEKQPIKSSWRKIEWLQKKVSSDARLKALFVSCPEERSCKLVDKIKEVQKMMRDFSIYKKDELLSMN